MGVIYCITNLINNKKYIGQTARLPKERWQEHLESARDLNNKRPLYKAMRKYGIENFVFAIVEECPNEELNSREQYWINIEQTWIAEYPDKGYNLTCGGNNGTKYSYDYIRTLYKQGMTQSEIREELHCDPLVVRQAILTDTIITDEYKHEHRSNAAKNSQKRIMKQVQAIDPITNEVYKKFDSISEASRFFNIDHACISTAIRKGKPHKCKNYYWEYCNKNDVPKTTTSIISIDINTGEEKIYPSIAQAAKQCNLNSSNIVEAINRNWRCGQWKWRYNKEKTNE